MNRNGRNNTFVFFFYNFIGKTISDTFINLLLWSFPLRKLYIKDSNFIILFVKHKIDRFAVLHAFCFIIFPVYVLK
jgi:hypothetical protein